MDSIFYSISACPNCGRRLMTRKVGPLYLDHATAAQEDATDAQENASIANTSNALDNMVGSTVERQRSQPTGSSNGIVTARSRLRRCNYDRNVVLPVVVLPVEQNPNADRSLRRSKRQSKALDRYNVFEIKCPMCRRTFRNAESMASFDDFFVCSVECMRNFF